MSAAPLGPLRRRPRRGSLERPISARAYRGTWLLVALPLLITAFSVARPAPLPAPELPAAFDPRSAEVLVDELAKQYPDRAPGTAGAAGALHWVADQLRPYGFEPRIDRFEATVPGRGRLPFANLIVTAPGRSNSTIVVLAHRDNSGASAGANDNASGTAALIELARSYANPAGSSGTPSSSRRVNPAHTIVFLSTDGGSLGGVGARQFADEPRTARNVVAVINLDAIAGAGRPRLELAGDRPRSPSMTLVATAAARVLEQTGAAAARPSALRQLVDLAFPFSFYEQAPFLGRGVSALTLTSAGDRPPPAFGDLPSALHTGRMGQIGRSAQQLLASLDDGLEPTQGTSTYIYLGSRAVRGWAIQLVLISALVPFLAGAVDLFALCRRRRIPLAPAFRSLRSRFGFWVWVLLWFELLGLLGVWPTGVALPPAPTESAGTDWPVIGVIALCIVSFAGWLVSRERLLPQLRRGGLLSRLATLVVGFSGPALLLGSFAVRFDLGLDAPWYLAELGALGYVQFAPLVITVVFAAASAQLAALSAGRYAPYPDRHERPPLGPARRVVRRIVLASRTGRRDRRAASAEPPAGNRHGARERNRPRLAREGAWSRPAQLHARRRSARLRRWTPNHLPRALLPHRLPSSGRLGEDRDALCDVHVRDRRAPDRRGRRPVGLEEPRTRAADAPGLSPALLRLPALPGLRQARHGTPARRLDRRLACRSRRSGFLGERQVAGRDAGSELAGAAGNVDKCVRTRGAGNHVRLLPGHGLEQDAVTVQAPPCAQELVAFRVPPDAGRELADGIRRKRLRMSLQREHRGTHEELESHERRNRIAGQSEDQRRAARAERDRLPGLDRDAPEDLLDAELSLELADEVELSNRHSSRGHEQIRLQAALERRPVRALVVRDGGGRTDFGARTRKRGGQHDAVRLVDLAWGEPFAGRLELASCCNHRRVRAACATDLGDARGGEGADLRRPEPRAARNDDVARPNVASARTHIRSALHLRWDLHVVVIMDNVLDRDDGVGAFGYDASGRDRESLSSGERPARRPSCGNCLPYRQPRGRICGADRVAVHR